MYKLLSQDPITPRGFEGTIPDLSTTDTSVINNFYKNTQDNITGDKFESVKNLLVVYTQFALSFAGYALMLALIYSGIRYMLAGDDEGKLTVAKNNLFWSIIGFSVVVLAYTIFNFFATENLLIGSFEEISASGNKVVAFKNIIEFLSKIIDWGLGILGIVFLFLLLINGFKYLLNSGSENTASAKKGFTNAIIGLVIVAVSYAIAFFIQNTLNNIGITPK